MMPSSQSYGPKVCPRPRSAASWVGRRTPSSVALTVSNSQVGSLRSDALPTFRHRRHDRSSPCRHFLSISLASNVSFARSLSPHLRAALRLNRCQYLSFRSNRHQSAANGAVNIFQATRNPMCNVLLTQTTVRIVGRTPSFATSNDGNVSNDRNP